MRKLIAWLCVAGAALCVTSIAWAGTPTSQKVQKRNGVIDITITQTDTLAKLGIDTLIVDLSKADWGMDATSGLLNLPLRLTNQNAATDSITIDVDASADGTRFDATESMNALAVNGTATNMGELVEWGRFIRFRILGADSTGLNSGYTIVVSVPGK